jgi:hypothetical protein
MLGERDFEYRKGCYACEYRKSQSSAYLVRMLSSRGRLDFCFFGRCAIKHARGVEEAAACPQSHPTLREETGDTSEDDEKGNGDIDGTQAAAQPTRTTGPTAATSPSTSECSARAARDLVTTAICLSSGTEESNCTTYSTCTATCPGCCITGSTTGLCYCYCGRRSGQGREELPEQVLVFKHTD